MKIMLTAGARPNFVKISALFRAFSRVSGVEVQWTHTGQHYDPVLSGDIIRQLKLPLPDFTLDCGHDTPGRQIARIMLAFEPVLKSTQPDWVLVCGDVNSTLACALSARKTGFRLAHIEAGLRCGDRAIPEEMNRILTDAMSDKWFVTEKAGEENLLQEGMPAAHVHLAGNCMVDTLFHNLQDANDQFPLRFPAKEYVLATFHRPSNVDHPGQMKAILELLGAVSEKLPVLFPVHPRTRAQLQQTGVNENITGLHLIESMNYLEFIVHLQHAALVITDSGGVQEETTALKVPCTTLRKNTERPVTIEVGTNQLMHEPDARQILPLLDKARSGRWKAGKIPDLWDGHAAERIVDILTRKPQKQV